MKARTVYRFLFFSILILIISLLVLLIYNLTSSSVTGYFAVGNFSVSVCCLAPLGGACAVDADCVPGLVCLAGVCAVPPAGGIVPGTSVGGGGGGGGSRRDVELKVYKIPTEVSNNEFTFSPSIITETLLQGERRSYDINVKSNGIKQEMRFGVQGLDQFITFDENAFILDIGQSKDLKLNLYAKKDQNPGIYFGKIIVKGNSLKEYINVIIKVKERNSLFDLKLDIPENVIGVGEKVLLYLKLENSILTQDEIDANVKFWIKNFDGDILSEYSSEFLHLSKDFTNKELIIPSDLALNQYLVFVEAEYNGFVTESYGVVKVVDKNSSIFGFWNIIIFTVLLILVISEGYIIYKSSVLRKQETTFQK